MAGRIRTIKPELREDIVFASVSERAALLFLMLYTLADDEGRCPAGTNYLAGHVFFARRVTPAAIGRALAELAGTTPPMIELYEVSRNPFLAIVGWNTRGHVAYQRIEKRQPAQFPAPSSFYSRNGSGNDSGNEPGGDSRTGSPPDPNRSEPTSEANSPRAPARAIPPSADTAVPLHAALGALSDRAAELDAAPPHAHRRGPRSAPARSFGGYRPEPTPEAIRDRVEQDKRDTRELARRAAESASTAITADDPAVRDAFAALGITK